ncbi:MAG TPA: dipeptidase [Verrucomicrobiales bacterium]|nr:dipeptidase [Akkermansiaceae bacterium]HRX55085.1 dipeptidase [Verrucomicrobiales bacterium]
MSHLDDLLTHLRFPSISTDPAHQEDVRACADWLVAKCRSIGLTTELHPTPGHPVVIARSEAKPNRPTVLIYGHYDVQPVDPLELWDSPPFEPEIRNGRIFARGSTDNKGQHYAHLCGVADTLAEKGELPVNVIFLLEGEEEIGSPHLEPFLRDHADELQCDVIAVSDTGMIGPGVPTLTYGLRGIACLEFKVSGPSSDLHSGIYGGAVMNPATAVARLVASLHGDNGRIAIEGFYDTVRPLQEWEREQWARLPDGDLATRSETGVPAVFGEAGYSSLERRWARPTAEVNGIWGGYQGAGSKTVIPREAFAKLSFRLVPDQDPQEVLRLARKHLERHCPPGVTLEIHEGHHGQWYVMDPLGPQGLAAQRALEQTFGKPSLLIREGGSIPIIRSFKDVLGTDTLMLGLALPDCQAHAPNENFPVANFEAGIQLNRYLLEELARLLPT